MTKLGSIGRAVNSRLARFNIAIAREAAVPSLDRFVGFLYRSNLVPKTVIDIGVAYGTDWLYASFPNAKFHLVDPTRESLPHMRAWAEKLNAEVHNVALGPQECSLEIAARDTIVNSTLLNDLTRPTIQETYRVPMRRFDSLFHAVERPALCKVDVEGAELMVLEGMGAQIFSLDAIVVETSMISLYENGPEFRDVMKYMSDHGFSLFEIGAITRRPYDGALHQMDAIFVPDQSPLRIRRWD
jgi:FkbM family methyltransferase